MNWSSMQSEKQETRKTGIAQWSALIQNWFWQPMTRGWVIPAESTSQLLHQQFQHPSETQSNQQGKTKFSQKKKNNKQHISPDYYIC